MILHPSLLTLMKLQVRGQVRRAVRGAKRPKGAVFLVIALVVGVLWLGPALLSAFIAPRVDPANVRAVVPAALLALVLVSAVAHGSDKAVSFTPAEVNFLFPGPFGRRELLLYKIAKSALGALLTSLFLSLVMLRYASLWPACLAGVLLAMLFLQLASMAVVLAGQAAGAAAHARRLRLAILFAVAAAVAVAVAPAARTAARADWANVLPALDASPAARVVLAPTRPIALAWTAQSYPQLLLWGTVSAAVVAALLLLVLRLDGNLMEVALEASRRQDEVMSRVRRGSVLNAAGKTGARAGVLRVPMPPRFGGAGPIAWRQLTTAFRTSRTLLIFLLIFGAGAVVPGVIVGGRAGGIGAVLPVVAWMTLILAATLKLDFRADLDRMDVLKALPLRPTAVAAGQVAAPVIVLATLHVALLGGLALFGPVAPAGGGRAVLAWATAAAVPFDLLLIGLENFVFLLVPTRPAAATPGDLSAMGRHALLFVVKGLALLVPCGLAAACGAAAYFAFDRSVFAAGAAAVAALAVQSLAVVPMVGWAFRRFDPSVDVPA